MVRSSPWVGGSVRVIGVPAKLFGGAKRGDSSGSPRSCSEERSGGRTLWGDSSRLPPGDAVRRADRVGQHGPPVVATALRRTERDVPGDLGVAVVRGQVEVRGHRVRVVI